MNRTPSCFIGIIKKGIKQVFLEKNIINLGDGFFISTHVGFNLNFVIKNINKRKHTENQFAVFNADIFFKRAVIIGFNKTGEPDKKLGFFLKRVKHGKKDIF